MMQRLKKMLAFLLVLILIGTSGNFSSHKVLAADKDEPQEIEVVSKTTDTIILKAEKNYEYAQRIVDTDKKTVWKWAEKLQYDTKLETVTFTGLEASKDYEFTRRTVGTADESKLIATTVRTADAANLPNNTEIKVPEEKKPETEPTVTEEKKPETKPTVTEEKKPETEPTVTEEKKPETIPAVTEEQKPETKPTVTEEQKPEMKPTVTEEKKPETEPTVTENKKPAAEPPVTEDMKDTKTPDPKEPKDNADDKESDDKDSKGEKQNTPLPAPDAPELKSHTDTEIVLLGKEDHEYAMIVIDTEPTWQAEPIFKNLKPDTEYTFAARYKNPDTGDVSDAGKTLTVKTKAAAAKAPAVPELDKKTDTMIQIKAAEGLEYALLEKDDYSSWNTNGKFEGLTPGTEYKIAARSVYIESETMPGEISKPLAVTTKLAAAKAPDAPRLSKRSETSITLQAQENLEYAISSDGVSWNWQNSSTFEGLKSQTAYQFISRVKFDPETAMGSKESPVAVFKTYIVFDGSIDGIKPDNAYYRGTQLTASAIGTGMNNTSPTEGDSRWIPRNWNWDGETYRSWSAAPYSVTFVLNKVGDYKMTVGFELEEYTADGWKGTDQTKTVSVSFKAITPVYNITASAEKNGKISPEGKIEVKEGNSAEFTFIPNKGYKTAKVLVDGKSVKFKDNKYTIANVKENHTIIVSFEAADEKTAPKTGDENPVTAYICMLAGSVLVLFILMTVRRKLLKKQF